MNVQRRSALSAETGTTATTTGTTTGTAATAGTPAGSGRAATRTATGTARRGLPFAAALFLLGLAIPVIMHIGGLRLSAYRLVLLVTVLPCLLFWLSGRAGRMIPADFWVLFYCLWSTLAANVIGDQASGSLEASGIRFIETAGAWFLARCTIRTPEAFHAMARLLFLIVIAIAPLAFYETVTTRNIALDLFRTIGPVFPDVPRDPRWGLDRVQGPFEHPILFGVFCGSIIGLTFYVLGYGRAFVTRLTATLAVLFTGGLTLSSGPLVAMTSQVSLIGWDLTAGRLIRNHWKVLAGLGVAAYIVIDLISNRTPFHVLASYLAFNANTAYSRIAIFKWGTWSIWNNPLFGIGNSEDWERLPHMGSSVDMFWILPGMRYGAIGSICFLVVFFTVIWAVMKRRDLGPRLSAYRTGYLVTMAGYFAVGWTVHFWNATYVLLLFLIASGVWLIDPRAAPSVPAAPRSGPGDRHQNRPGDGSADPPDQPTKLPTKPPPEPPKRRTLL